MHNSILMIPTTFLREPSQALAIMVHGNICVKSIGISFNTCFGSTFIAKPFSTNTLPMVQSLHLIVMYRGLLWSVSPVSSLSLVKYK